MFDFEYPQTIYAPMFRKQNDSKWDLIILIERRLLNHEINTPETAPYLFHFSDPIKNAKVDVTSTVFGVVQVALPSLHSLADRSSRGNLSVHECLEGTREALTGPGLRRGLLLLSGGGARQLRPVP